MKSIVAWTYSVLMMVGAIAGCLGLLNENADMAGIGNAMFLAGALTPIILLGKFTTKDALVGAVWASTVAYFSLDGSLNGYILIFSAPVLLIISIVLTKYSGVKLGRPLSTPEQQ